MTPKVVAIIQARMGSSRLPKKTLKTLAGEPVLSWHTRRLQACKLVDEVVVATSDKPIDDAIARYCEEQGTACFRGSEEDVLGRFVGCARSHKAEIIVRLTGDEPLIAPEIVDRAVQKYLDGGVDLISTGFVPCIPKGLDCEVFARELLERLGRDASTAEEREHVTFQAYRDGRITIAGIDDRIAAGEYRPEIVLTLDTKTDYRFLQRLCKGLAKDASYGDIIKHFDSKPQYYLQRVSRRPFKLACIITVGKQYGSGHMHSMLGVLRALRRHVQAKTRFYLLDVDGARSFAKQLREQGFTVSLFSTGLAKMLRENVPDAVLVDADTRTMRRLPLRTLARQHPLVLFDHREQGDVRPAMLFNRNLLYNERLDYRRNPSTFYYTGTRFFTLTRERITKKVRHAKVLRKVLITFGNSDPKDLTHAIIEHIQGEALQVTVLLGSLYRGKAAIKAQKRKMHVIRGTDDIFTLMRGHDVIISNSGRTAYEACIVGTPAVLLPQNRGEAQVADEFERLGCAERIRRPGEISRALTRLANAKIRERMASRQRSLVDEHGSARVVVRIATLLTNLREKAYK